MWYTHDGLSDKGPSLEKLDFAIRILAIHQLFKSISNWNITIVQIDWNTEIN